MPLVYHKKDFSELKKILEEQYLFDFDIEQETINEYSDKTNYIDFDVKSLKLKNAASVADCAKSLLSKAATICSSALNCNQFEYLGKTHYKRIVNDDLLTFVLMDALVNIDSYTEDSSLSKNEPPDIDKIEKADTDRSFESLYAYFGEYINKEYVKSKYRGNEDLEDANALEAVLKNNYSNLRKNLIAARSLPFIKNAIINDYLSPEWRTENSYENFPGKTPYVISREFARINLLLIRNIKFNPYYKLGLTSTDKASIEKTGISDVKSELIIDELEQFFLNQLYSKIKISSDHTKTKYQYFMSDKIELIKSMYYLDLHFDLANNIYIAIKIEELQKYEMGTLYNDKDLYDLFSLCLLIPDVFNKKQYIDLMFECLKQDGKLTSEYRAYVEYDGEIASDARIGNIADVVQNNLYACKGFILFLSKIYLPLLSACFYVLVFDSLGIKKGKAFIKAAAKTFAGKYFDNFFEDMRMPFSLIRNMQFTKKTMNSLQSFFERMDYFSGESRLGQSFINPDYLTSFAEECLMVNNSLRSGSLSSKSWNRFVKDTKGAIAQHLPFLYESIYENIYSDELLYKDIMRSLSITEVPVKSIRKMVRDFYIKQKIQPFLYNNQRQKVNLNLKDPILKEKS